jgi:hypothetical protein
MKLLPNNYFDFIFYCEVFEAIVVIAFVASNHGKVTLRL